MSRWTVHRELFSDSYFSINSGNLEITVDYLVEIDKLVQLIESPIFACKFLQVAF